MGKELSLMGGSGVEGNVDVKVILDILSHDNTAEVKRNKKGEIIILEIEKKIRKSK